jgi:hypothetical protein
VFWGAIYVRVSQPFATSTKYLRKATWRRNDLFWLKVSEISIHGQLVPLLWAWSETQCHSWWQNHMTGACAPHRGWMQREKEKWLRIRCPLQGHTPRELLPRTDLPSMPPTSSNYESINGLIMIGSSIMRLQPSWSNHLPKSATSWGPNLQHMSLWGHFISKL